MAIKKIKNKSVIFFARVNDIYLSRWEYYSNDIEILKNSYDEVIIANGYLLALRLLVKHRGADLFCWWWHISAPVILFAFFFRRRIYCTGAIHMFDCSGAPDFFSRSWFYRFLIKISLRLSSYNIFISTDQYISITSHLFVRSPIVLHSALPPSKGGPPHINLSYFDATVNNKPIVFLFFSWLSLAQIKRKGLFILLEAFAKFVLFVDPNAKLVIGGKSDNALLGIEIFINKLGISQNVDFALDLTHAEKCKLYDKSDLLITPSYMEGFGNASLEAMSRGCPALVSRFGASHEVVGEFGYIINSIDANSIFEKLISYHQLSHVERLKMRTSVYKYTWEKFNFENRLLKFKEICF